MSSDDRGISDYPGRKYGRKKKKKLRDINNVNKTTGGWISTMK
jgi:hypothetical protein